MINGIGLIDVVAVLIPLKGALLGFVEEAIHMLFAARRKTMQLRESQFFFKLEDALRKGFPLDLQRGDFGSISRQKPKAPSIPHQGCRLESL
ncbi:hypothetical protein EV128_13732 [Rhizobium azibense]|nr:hypothetical protein EV128_13732 [Rhizobium azibense]